jgi:hypothetical protein
MAQITVNEALAWQKTLKARYAELVALRDENGARTRRFIGAHGDKEIVKEPVYDIKKLDKLITGVAKDMRLLDAAIKKSNALTVLADYSQDDAVLGEVE